MKRTKSYLFILFIWLVVTAINWNKAYTVDDVFHLQAAQNLLEHPESPLSGKVLWGNYPTQMHQHNQPPLFFYCMAGFMYFFGESEPSMHALISIFSLISLFFFYKICLELNVKKTNLLLALFGFSPAFIVNQNVMVDIPLLSMAIGTIYFLIRANRIKKWTNYLFANLFLGIGLLIKYTVFPLLLVIPIVIILRKDFIKLFSLSIPIGMLVLWSYWNLEEYGSIHLLDRERSGFNPYFIIGFLGCLGSMSLFVPSFFHGIVNHKRIKSIIIFSVIVFFVTSLLVYIRIANETAVNSILNMVFIVSGFIQIAILFYLFLTNFKKDPKEYLGSIEFVLALTIGAFSAFIVLFAPFLATRHLLLVIPFVILYGNKLFDKTDKHVNLISLSLTLFIGIALSISDWVYSDYYRKMPKEVIEKTNGKILSTGYWGWQWYSEKNGMIVYDWETQQIEIGDHFAFPTKIAGQFITAELKLEPVDTLWKEATILTLFSGKNNASLYNSDHLKPAWNLSMEPCDTILISKVVDGFDVYDFMNRIKSDEAWFQSIETKAKERGISADSMLLLDAKWLFNRRNK